jgi:hypothetical protein
MPGIFISYRREDSAGYPGRLYDVLTEEFGEKSVFMDVDGIRPGEDFIRLIEEKVAACDVLVALIGRKWLDSADERGKRRLENAEDFVRLEIAHALRRGIRVVPVLVGGASMPPAVAMPDELKALSARNGLEIHDSMFRESVRRLVAELRAVMGGQGVRRKALRMAVGVAAVALIGASLAIFAPDENSRGKGEASAAEKMPDLEDASGTAVKVKVKIPEKITELPAAEEADAGGVLTPPESHEVTGPRRPRLLWSAPVTTGGAWDVVALAGDGTAFLWDKENYVVSGVGAGGELWAYTREAPRYWSVRGYDDGGRLWLEGSDADGLNGEAASFFNS